MITLLVHKRKIELYVRIKSSKRVHEPKSTKS